ncbi:hypothetical protein ACFOLL_04575 [Falsochrobactrum ovis]|uniref:Uncharacterized protein n=1 Tax=Falsochrobactrum ovis TaxID=1293442 RepID=A0A364JVM7_9HYPH|nr:hypothetical protein [Falsochrobactrum ovis]RAK29108.1 hypothetical protein C7374_105159 [Falsochrobactrum ovis]
MSKLIVEAITEHYGERCPDYDEDCFCCKVWSDYDALTSPARCDELVTIGATYLGKFSPRKNKAMWPDGAHELVTRQNAEEVIAAKDAQLERLADDYQGKCDEISRGWKEFKALEAENKRLREALMMIAKIEFSFPEELRDIARAVLGGKPF